MERLSSGTHGVRCEHSVLAAGWTTHRESLVIDGGRRRRVAFPALVAVVRHPTRGVVVFDTGYSERVSRVMSGFPETVLKRLLPVHVPPSRTLVAQLAERGIAAGDVSTVVLSHFHADHIGAAADFPNACYAFLPDAYEAVRGRSRLGRLLAGFFPGLLPDDFETRAVGPGERVAGTGVLAEFEHVYDLFGDGALRLVELPGHARGQLGLYVHTAAGERLFVADACVMSGTVCDDRAPGALLRVAADDWARYRETIERLRRVATAHPRVSLIPSHCGDAYRVHVAGASDALGGTDLNRSRTNGLDGAEARP